MLRAWFDTHPLGGALALWVVDIMWVLAGAALLSMLFPGLPGYSRGLSQSFILVLLGVVLVAALLTALRWWRRAGFVDTAEWRNLRLFWLPVLVALLPLVAGINPLPTSEVITLVVAYAATAFFEEAMYRGLVLGVLRPTGLWPAVLLSSLLFGLVHLSNIALRGNPALIALQALGAATDGVGMAALRLRTRTIVPGIGLHAFHDFILQMGRLPVPLLDAVYDIVLLAYGIYLLRPSVRAAMEPDPADEAAPAAPPVGVPVN